MMSNKLNDDRVRHIDKLDTPKQIKEEFPVTPQIEKLVLQSRQNIQDILDNKSKRLVVIVGPCSIHDKQIAIEYAQFLAIQREIYKDTLEIVMRTYFTKPRTTTGWKGFIYDPDMNNTYDTEKGLREGRKLLLEIMKLGVPCGMEHVDTIIPQYFSDLVSWSAIGARTTESQIHRELASGVSSPVGFKNGTSGDIQIAVNAIKCSNKPHHFIGCDGEGNICNVSTQGNPYCHIILRGAQDHTNYDLESVNKTLDYLREKGVNESIFIDFSHGNSQKQHKRQLIVSEDVCANIASGNNSIRGVMIESNISEGNQSIGDNMKYGVSITDACIDLDDTKIILEQLHKSVEKRN